MIAAGTAVAIEPAQEPERRPPAESEPEPEAEPDARCVDDAGSEGRANTAVDPWEIGPLPSASNPVGNDIPAGAPASEPQHVGGAVEPADLADTIDLTPVGDRDAAMPVRESEAHSHDRGRHPARGLRHGRRHVRVGIA